MAYSANQLFSETAGRGSGLRAFPETVQPKTFASGSGTLAALTPVTYNTSTNKWTTFTNGGANGTGTILGFVWPDAIVLDAANDVIGNVLLEGKINFNDIPQTGAGYTLAQLKAAVQSQMRPLGIIIEGLDSVR